MPVSKSATVGASPYFEVQGDSDCEGRGPRYNVGCFFDEGSARSAASGKGGMGSMGYIKQVTGLVVTTVGENGEKLMYVCGAPISLHYEDPAVTRKRALAKLTPGEIAALGLSK